VGGPTVNCVNRGGTILNLNAEYALITPAKNEEGQIQHTIRSMVRQLVLPQRWVIVNDGSTDRTGEIVEQYARDYDFIIPVHSQKSHGEGFGSKVRAFEAGYALLKNTDYRFIGNLDADVSFEEGYFEKLLGEFSNDSQLGLAGGIILEQIGEHFVPQRISANSVAGAVQLFRRECFEQINGYRALTLGGIDTVAEIMARMKGWTVRTVFHLPVMHYGRVTTGCKSVCRSRFNKGFNNYLLGYHPLFHVMASLSRATVRPYIVGSFMMMAGYLWAYTNQAERPLPFEVMDFLRKEQMKRIWSLLRRGPSMA
jgi:glycosyltransferase involved in cell wall biosynthesis